MQRNSWMIAIHLLWRRGYYWEAVATWFVMQWVFVEAFCLPRHSMRRAIREIEKAKR